MPEDIVAVQKYVLGLDNKFSAVWHRVPSLDSQVHDYLLNLSRISLRSPQSLVWHEDKFNVLTDQPSKHLFHFRHYCVQVEHFGLQHLHPAEGQELAGQ